MSRFEAEAREVLLRRRRSLSHGTTAAAPADPSARWSDYEGQPEPMPEDVRRELADIDAALARIQEGRYGTCLNCGGPLGLQRLRALPEARFCVACSGSLQQHHGE
ncbi:TraR/DksA family transcriptional regulator [Anaeromyxobacter oryzisoli]|jgi:RNA polymerase-binding transcription factor|uniref:TraR/DksA family transcriptional regulator n=1 Tax=Anaeromyxobacter oryzisoli TaxID=2925408 RepID=UPI001F5A29A2|nr:TraR/DksA C4-type zinc finger protein [Anaeromyxobacter sp. SG63]